MTDTAPGDATPPLSAADQDAAVREIVAEVLAFIEGAGCTDAEFDALALRLHAHQYERNVPYRRFCQRRGATPRAVKGWRDIPATPISAFKQLSLVCQAPSGTDRVFMTSGTTQADVKGRHHHATLAVYDRSMTLAFARRFMQGTDRMRMGILFPDEQALPNSSLAHYLALARRDFGAAGSACFVGPAGLDGAGLCEALADAERSGQPYALLGATFSLVHLIDDLARRGASFRLPPGSRVLDTGGYKGRSRELPPEAFYAELSGRLGVERGLCINMYGMTELSTQFYDAGNAVVPSVKSGPHWIRSRPVDPATGRDVARGAQGVLVHCDLANVNSVTTILTEDVGVAVDGGFLLLGRAEGTQARGCSLAAEEFVRGAGP